MKRVFFLGLVAAISMVGVNGQAATCAEHFMFDPKPRLSLSDVARLSDRTSNGSDGDVQTTDGGQLVFWPFDDEDHPTRGAWRAVGLIYATRGDLGEATVGGLLLQARAEPSEDVDQPAPPRTADGRAVSISFSEHQRGCPPFIVKLDNTGALFAGGRFVGRLK